MSLWAENIERLPPREIERRSLAVIAEELGDIRLPPDREAVIKRVIHTTADFDYAHTLRFSEGAVRAGQGALLAGKPVVTDTTMALSGINKGALAKTGAECHCFVADADVAEAARQRGVTRSAAAVEKAARLFPDAVFAVGNAPTALLRILELAEEGALTPALVIGVPVGFVNVVQSKELLLASPLPHIVARGRKGGSTVAAAILNALLYALNL